MRRSIVLGLFLLWPSLVRADVIYTYTGNTFGSLLECCAGTYPPTVTGPYSLDMRIEGFLRFTEALTLGNEFVPATSAGYTAIPIDYSFTDGVQTLTTENSTIRFIYGGRTVLTNSPFDLEYSLWAVEVFALPVNGVVNSITTYALHYANDDIGRYFGDRGRVSPNPNPNEGNPGTWTTTVSDAVPVPEPSTALLVGLAFVWLWRHAGHVPFAAK